MTARTVAYTNRMGVTFYAHVGRTKTGKPRYFVAKTIGDGALSALPDGFEIIESINGVVSVRRIPTGTPVVLPGDLDLARAELSRHGHLASHRADVVKGEIIVFEPAGALDPAGFADMAQRWGLGFGALGGFAARVKQRIRYAPVMKFVPAGDGKYSVHRMTYRGHGGWSWTLATGTLEGLLARYIRPIGTNEFFELL